MRGHIAYCRDERSDLDGWRLLAVAIINRTVRDAQANPEEIQTKALRRRAEKNKADAIAWIEAVDPSVLPMVLHTAFIGLPLGD